MQLMVPVRRDCQYLHRVNPAAPREALHCIFGGKIKAVMCGRHDMMLLYFGERHARVVRSC
jgi:hypothetical protein